MSVFLKLTDYKTLDLFKEYGFSNRVFNKQIRVPVSKKYKTAMFLAFESEISLPNRLTNYKNHFTMYKNEHSVLIVRVESSIKHVDVDAVLMYDHITPKVSAKSEERWNWVVSYDEIEYSSELPPDLDTYDMLCSGEWWYFDRGVILNGIAAFGITDDICNEPITSTFIYFELHPDYEFEQQQRLPNRLATAIGGTYPAIASSSDTYPAIGGGGTYPTIAGGNPLVDFNTRTVIPFMAQFFGPPKPFTFQQNNLFTSEPPSKPSSSLRPPSRQSLTSLSQRQQVPENDDVQQQQSSTEQSESPNPNHTTSPQMQGQQGSSSSPVSQEPTTSVPQMQGPSPVPQTQVPSPVPSLASTAGFETIAGLRVEPQPRLPASRIVMPGSVIVRNDSKGIQGMNTAMMSVVPSLYWFHERSRELLDSTISYFIPYEVNIFNDEDYTNQQNNQLQQLGLTSQISSRLNSLLPPMPQLQDPLTMFSSN